MKRLYLLRHAKSSWDDPSLDDYERPLNPRGRTAAPFMGELIARKGLVIDAIVSSPAERARQTAEIVKEAAGMNAPLSFDARIYDASVGTLLVVLATTPADAGSAMLVGHNPGFEGLIRALTGTNERLPTAALAVIDLDIDDWTSVGPGKGDLVAVIRPKDEIAKLARRETPETR